MLLTLRGVLFLLLAAPVIAAGTWVPGTQWLAGLYLVLWQAPLGLILKQARIEASGPVKVYPNLLDVRRYDLLLRRSPALRLKS